MESRGKYQTAIEQAKGPAEVLAAAARLLHDQGFDPVPIELGRLAGEVRTTASCAACGAIWVGTKAGEILRVDLGGAAIEQRTVTLASGVRALLHLHGETAFGASVTLLAGTDDGHIHLFEDRPGEAAASEIHLESWWSELRGNAIPATSSIPGPNGVSYSSGITAMIRLPGEGGRILVATRTGALFLLAGAAGKLTLRRVGEGGPPRPSSGWIQWILRAEGDTHVTAISRGGDFTRVSIDHPEGDVELSSLSILPASAAPWLRGFLLGTTEGLLYWERGRRPDLVSVPLARTAVLCLQRLAIPGEAEPGEAGESGERMVLGLGSGLLRVFNLDVVQELVDGHTASPDVHGCSTDLGSAVLAVTVLEASGGDPGPSFILAALRDQSIRLFHVDRRAHAHAVIGDAWKAFAASLGRVEDDLGLWDELAARQAPGDLDAVKYLLVDAVFPRLSAASPAISGALRARFLGLVEGASVEVLRRVSRGIASFAGQSADALLELSATLLRAMPRQDEAHFTRFVELHLKALHEATRGLTDPGDQARLVAWTRFVRKYVLLGTTFTEKTTSLKELCEVNARAGKHLDALVYQAELHRRRHDLVWQASIEGEIHSLHPTSELVIAAGHDGRVWFFDPGGRLLHVQGDGQGRRLLAAALIPAEGAEVRLAVSFADLTPSTPDTPLLFVLEIANDGGKIRVTERAVEVGRGERLASVHSLIALSDDLLLAGLDDPERLFGVLRFDGDRPTARAWRLEVVRGDARLEPPTSLLPGPPASGVSTLVPGKAPSRALAALRLDRGVYLVAIGSDDGMLRIARFHDGDSAETVVSISHALVNAITSVALDRTAGAGGALGGHVCYVGTSTGEVFVGEIVGEGADASTQPVWRESYDRPIVALQPWSTPLYPDRPVLVTATEKGALSFHETRRFGSDDAPRISELNNYYFRGLRLDRMTLPGPLTAFVAVDGGRSFLAGGPGGRIRKGLVWYARGSRSIAPTITGRRAGCRWSCGRAFARSGPGSATAPSSFPTPARPSSAAASGPSTSSLTSKGARSAAICCACA